MKRIIVVLALLAALFGFTSHAAGGGNCSPQLTIVHGPPGYPSICAGTIDGTDIRYIFWTR